MLSEVEASHFFLLPRASKKAKLEVLPFGFAQGRLSAEFTLSERK